MKSFLDFIITFLSEYGIWLIFTLIGIFMGIIWIGIAIENRKEKKQEKVKILTKKSSIQMLIVVFIPFFIWLFVSEINPSYFGYGYSTNNLNIVSHQDSALWGIDYYVQSGGGIGSSTIYRIQGINLNNGKKLFKKMFSYAYDIEGTFHQLVWMKTEVAEDEFELEGINIFTGKTVNVITKNSLQQNVPELSSGVYEFSYNSKTNLLDVISKDGLKINVDPENYAKKDSAIENDVRSNIDKYSIHDLKGNTIITMIRDGEREKLYDKTRQVIPSNLFFLKGQFICLDTISQSVFTFSYETLEQKNFLIRSVSYSGKLLWEVNQQTLGVGDFFVSEPNFETSFIYKDALILGLNGFVFSLNKKTGELNWLTRL